MPTVQSISKTIMAPLPARQNKKPVNLDSIEAMTKDTDRPVTGTFLNVECPGQPAKICVRLYRGMDLFVKNFMDGEKCTIPLSVARHINERCNYEKHEHLLDDKGNPVKNPKAIPRYKFNLEF
jgi:hypothetical protein